jgi:hypothetical protein
MDAQQALADLTEISSQIEAAVVFDDKGKVVGSTVPAGTASPRRPAICSPRPRSCAAATRR